MLEKVARPLTSELSLSVMMFDTEDFDPMRRRGAARIAA